MPFIPGKGRRLNGIKMKEMKSLNTNSVGDKKPKIKKLKKEDTKDEGIDLEKAKPKPKEEEEEPSILFLWPGYI